MKLFKRTLKFPIEENSFTFVDLIKSSHPEVFCKKAVLKNLVKFTGKHLCQSLYDNMIKSYDAKDLNKIYKKYT